MTGASAAVGGENPTDTWQRISTPASTIGPGLPQGELGAPLADGLWRGGGEPAPPPGRGAPRRCRPEHPRHTHALPH